MANALFFNLPFYGHMNPTLPLVAELTRRGERTGCYTSETFRPAVERVGATYRDMDALFAGPIPVDGNLVRFAYTLMRVTQEILPPLLEEVSADPPDYIIFDSLCIWGKCVAEILRIPAIASIATLARPHSVMHREIIANMVPILPSSVRMLYAGRRELRQFNAIANQLHETYRIPKIQLGDAYNNLAELNIVYSIRDLQNWPNAFDRRFKFVGPFLGDRDETTDFPLDELDDQPVIYISLGTVFNTNDNFYRHCFQAFAGRDTRVVMAVGEKTDIGRLGIIPDNFVVKPFVPQLQILRRSVLFITHGGMNSVNEGLVAGVPLLVVPQGADQFLIARRIQQLGAGLTLDPDQVSAYRLRHTADRIRTNPAFQHRSAQLGVSLRQAGSPASAADEIDVFKRGHGIA